MSDYRFEIALSFAGTYRKKVLEIAEVLRRSIGDGRVFYDHWFQHEVLGHDTDLKLDRIYSKQTRMVVVFLSKGYPDRDWCRCEWGAIRGWRKGMDFARDDSARLRLAYVRLDQCDVPGVNEKDEPYYAIDEPSETIAEHLLKRHRVLLAGDQVPPPPPTPLPLPLPPPPPPPLERSIRNSLGAVFVPVPPGRFMMGSPKDEPGRPKLDDELKHEVSIGAFYLCTTSVTQSQWTRVMGANPSEFCGADRPVERVTWEEGVEFCRRLSNAENRAYRLPTEAEWEYACRAGSHTAYPWGSELALGKDFANLYDQAGRRASRYGYGWEPAPWDDGYPKTSPVGHFRPNQWGLYDMIGNVWEWCSDWYAPYPIGPVSDPQGPKEGELKVMRGSSWYDDPRTARAACRNKLSPYLSDRHIGFRVVLDGV